MGLFDSKACRDIARFVIILSHGIIFEAGSPPTCPIIYGSTHG